jgi:hypothetical protein
MDAKSALLNLNIDTPMVASAFRIDKKWSNIFYAFSNATFMVSNSFSYPCKDAAR